MRNRMLTGSALGVVATLALAGCGGGTNGAASGQVTINMVQSLTSPVRTKLLKAQIAAFEKVNPKINVNLISPPTDSADQKIKTMLQSKNGIDVLEVRDITVGPFNANGWLYDMTKDVKAWNGWNDITDVAKTSTIQNGKVLSIPNGSYAALEFYRTDLVKQAGFSGPPKTWNELIQQSEKINDPGKNIYGNAFRGGNRASNDAYSIIEAYNADLLDPANAFKLKSGGTIFSTPQALSAMNAYLELFKKGSPPSAVAWGYPEMVQGFNSGTTAFLRQTQEVIATIQASTSIKADQWATAPLPVGPTGKATQPVGIDGWGVATSSTQKPAAVKLAEFLTSGSRAIEFAKINGQVPDIKSAVNDPFFKTGPWAAYLYMNNHPETYMVVTEPRSASWWSEWEPKADSDLQSVLTGRMTTRDMLAGWDSYWMGKWKTSAAQ